MCISIALMSRMVLSMFYTPSSLYTLQIASNLYSQCMPGLKSNEDSNANKPNSYTVYMYVFVPSRYLLTSIL